MIPTANWSYPTAIKFGPGRIAELAAACAQAGIARPLLVTDRGLAAMAITGRALDILDAAGPRPRLFAEVDPNPNEKNLAAGSPPTRPAARRRRRLRRRLGARPRQDGRLHGGPDPAALGLRGRRRLVDPRRPDGHRPHRRGADDRRHRLGGRPRRRHHQLRDPREEDHLPPEGAARRGHHGPGADRGHAPVPSPPAPAWTPSPIASRPTARPSTTR
jgi:hypothetical protein